VKKILIIQTAFIGDAILATALVETLAAAQPNWIIDLCVRKGNESLLTNNPHLRKVWIFNKKEGKYKNLWRLAEQFRAERYDEIINVQRFATTGLLTVLARGKHTTGFSKNPLSFMFSRRVNHSVGDGTHETSRNHQLVSHLVTGGPLRPKMYPSAWDYASIQRTKPYVTIAPTSVWLTKQWPAKKWIELIDVIPLTTDVLLLGGPPDAAACQAIAARCNRPVENLAGTLSFLQSAALMAGAEMNYVNDSAPLHMASAMNAPTTAIFCSTVPSFGFTPLADNHRIVETDQPLACRPCGLHGYKACPLGHFQCADIPVQRVWHA
jgi:heptosyltransferase-2